MAGREQDYYTAARQHNQAIWNALNNLVGLQREWNALDYGNTLDDGENTNAGLTKTELGAVVFDTTNAMLGVLAAGHATNMAKLL
jgi:hypothetical protein